MNIFPININIFLLCTSAHYMAVSFFKKEIAYFYLVCMSDLPAWMYVEHILGIWRGRRGCRSLDLELQVVISCHVGAGNGFPVLFLQGWSVL